VLTCYRTRRRIGAYLDEALDDRESASAAAHIAVCARCHAEVDSLRRLSAMLRRSVPQPPLPDWTGFWEGVRRGIEPRRVEVRARPRWRPRLVAGTALAAVVGLAVFMWQAPRNPFTPQAAAAISVSSADTAHPGGTVMVYSPPEKDLAVVWLFASEDSED
jgi:anti-sigma factor RsiW